MTPPPSAILGLLGLLSPVQCPVGILGQLGLLGLIGLRGIPGLFELICFTIALWESCNMGVKAIIK